jgi:hypothetical protein
LKKTLSAFTALLVFLFYGCAEKAEQSQQFYEMQDFDREIRFVLDNENFSIIEFWENGSHLEPIPREIEALHQAIDDERSTQRSTAYLTAESKEKGTVRLQFWVVGDQVGAVKISSPDEKTSEKIKAALLRRLPDLTVSTDMESLTSR